MISSRSFHSDGFTLLEVMIAVAILAITLTVIYGSQSQSLSLAAEARFNTTATFLADIKLAELESGIMELVDDSGEFEDFPGYSWKVEMQPTSFVGSEILEKLNNEVEHISLTISWAGSNFTHVIDYYEFSQQ